MDCIKCKASNPDGKNFCGECGAPLDPTIGHIDNYLQTNLPLQLKSLIKEQYKDQKLVEAEVTEMVVNKISGWAKLFSYFVGIPLALLALLLGVFGVKSYSDFSKIVDAGKTEISKTFQVERQNAQQQANYFKKQSDVFKSESEELGKKSAELKTRYQQLERQLSGVDALAQNVRSLTNKVERIEEKIGFERSALLTPDLQNALENSFVPFRNYLSNLGFKAKKGKIQISIDRKYDDNVIYDPASNKIIIGPSMSNDSQTAYYIYTIHALGRINEFSSNSLAAALQSGLADYFACSFTNKALIGEGYAKAKGGKVPGTDKSYLRNLSNNFNFSEIDKKANIYDAGEIWGGAFWELRNLTGKQFADKLLFLTWQSLQKQELNENVVKNFITKLLSLAPLIDRGQDTNKIKFLFEKRGVKL